MAQEFKFSVRGGARRSPEVRGEEFFEDLFTEMHPIFLEWDLRKYLPEVKDQGDFPICASMAGATIMECRHNWNHLIEKPKIFSPWFIYNNRSNQDQDGMFGRDVMRILSDCGDCLYKTYLPNGPETIDRIPVDAFREARKYQIYRYAPVKTIKGAKMASLMSGCLYISFPLYTGKVPFWIPEEGQGEPEMGHAVTVCGYNKEGFIIRNSWGRSWGDQGYCIYPFKDFGAHWEIWTQIEYFTYGDNCCGGCF